MRVIDATGCPDGTRIKVLRVAPSRAEALGYVKDTELLTGQLGTVRALRNARSADAQVDVDWDDPRVGSLMLCAEDEFEVLERPAAP